MDGRADEDGGGDARRLDGLGFAGNSGLEYIHVGTKRRGFRQRIGWKEYHVQKQNQSTLAEFSHAMTHQQLQK